jgi:hypothetical protein
MISLRKPHLRRRAEPNKELIVAFLDRLDTAEIEYDPRYIINCDETNWPVIRSPRKNWHKKTAPKSEQNEMKAEVHGDPKLSFTLIAAINQGEEGLPLYMLAKGKTERCERQLNAKDETS